MEGKQLREVAVNQLLQFVECATHLVLKRRGIYRSEHFVDRKRFGITASMCRTPGVHEYVKQFLKCIKDLVLQDRMKAVTILINNDLGQVQERFVIEFPSDFGRSIFYGVPTGSNRTDLDVVCACAELLSGEYKALESKIPKLETDCGFREWSFFLDMKAIELPSESVDIPVGCTKISSHDEKIFRDNSEMNRIPLKSAVMNDQVLISTYLDLVR